MVDYKLRLGDGTTLSVDEKGLNTWVSGGMLDDKARVQPAGSKKWFSLKQILAAQGAQRGHAERQTEKGRADVDRQAAEEVAAIEKRVAEQRATEERKASEDLAAAQRKAEDERTAADRKIIQDRADAERRAAEELAAAEARAAAEKQAELDRIAREKREAEERVAAAARAAAEAEAARLAEAERAVAAERAERAERKRKAEEERLAAEEKKAEAARAEAARIAEAARVEEARVAEAERQVAAERAERAERKRRADEERVAAEAAARARVAVVESMDVPAAPDPVVEPDVPMKVEDFQRDLGLVPVTFNDGAEPIAAETPSVAPSAPAKPAGASPVTRAVQRMKGFFARSTAPADAISAPSISAPPPAPPPPAPLPPTPPIVAAPAPTPAPAPPRSSPAKEPPPWAAPPPAPWTPQAAATIPAARTKAFKPSAPPPSLSKMEVIPFAATPVASRAAEEMFDGEDEWTEPGRISSAFSTMWTWTKRVTIAAALIAGIAALAFNRQKWQPQAESAAIVLGQNVDKLSARGRTVPPQAIAAAAAQCPHLRPQTIELVMAKSTEGALDAAEVFRRAHQAAERARPSLPAAVAAELDSAIADTAKNLDGPEAGELSAYFANLRAGTATADYQDKEAVWLMSRAVRRLSADRLARLQELLAGAVAAGLETPPQP